jgi:hypothetical protein
MWVMDEHGFPPERESHFDAPVGSPEIRLDDVYPPGFEPDLSRLRSEVRR